MTTLTTATATATATVTLFSRQRTSTFNPSSRELVWAQAEGYVNMPEYGNHMYQLEVCLKGTPLDYLESDDVVPSGYTYGVRPGTFGTWYCINPSTILSCTYVGEMGDFSYLSPEDKLTLFQGGNCPLFKLKKLEEGVFSFRLDGTVVIDFNHKTITPPEDWDEDDWEDNSKLLKLLTKTLFS